jgi:hypothetical protein
VIPETWLPRHREDDGELVGYLVGDGDEVVPVSLVGHPVGPGSDEETAGALLDWRGLPSLDRRFWTRWPGDEGWTSVRIIEASPVQVTIRREVGTPADLRQTITLPNPAADVLLHDPPA